MSIDINKITVGDLSELCKQGIISRDDINKVLEKRGLIMTFSGIIKTKDGELYCPDLEPIYSRWEILDL